MPEIKNEELQKFIESLDEIQFNHGWHNGTGQLPDCCKENSYLSNNGERYYIPLGGIVRCKDDYGRQILILNTCEGLVAIFQRYFMGDCLYNWVFNAQTKKLEQALDNYIASRLIHEDTVKLVITTFDDHLASLAD